MAVDDMTVVYNVNPAAVSELWATKNKTFHGLSEKGGDILLMQNYVALGEEKLAEKITVSQVQVRAITPADVIVANGKVQSIVVPYDFKGIVNAK